MEQFLKGACQLCGGHLEFPTEALGGKTECPHCGRVTALKPSAYAAWQGSQLPLDGESPEAPIPDLTAVSDVDLGDDEDPLRRMLIKTAIIGVILVAVLIMVLLGLQYFASRLPHPAHP